jgi:hypothetical protein
VAGRLDGAGDLLPQDGGRIALAGRYRHEGAGHLAVRPESIRLAPPGSPKTRVEGTVKLCTYLGALLEHVVRLDSGRDVIVREPVMGPDATRRWDTDDRVSLIWSEAAERIFDDQDRAVPNVAENEPAATQGEDKKWARTP